MHWIQILGCRVRSLLYPGLTESQRQRRMKALLFTLIRAFEFQLAVPASDIKGKTSVVQRPVIASDPGGKNQLPLLIKAYQRP